MAITASPTGWEESLAGAATVPQEEYSRLTSTTELPHCWRWQEEGAVMIRYGQFCPIAKAAEIVGTVDTAGHS
jgi:hypothetical protein